MLYAPRELRLALDNLKSNRSSLEYEWSSVFRLTRPNRLLAQYFRNTPYGGGAGLNTSQSNLSTIHSLYDNRGATNSAILSSYLHSSLTNPHDVWMSLFPSEEVDLTQTISEEDIQKLQHLEFLGRQCNVIWQSSNFHQTMYPFYRSLVDIGNSCIISYKIKAGGQDELMFQNRSMFNVYFEENIYGQPDKVFCIYNWTARQIIQFFELKTDVDIEQRAGGTVLNAFKIYSQERFTVVHSVAPDSPTATDGKYISSYFMYDQTNKGLNTSEGDSSQDIKTEEYEKLTAKRMKSLDLEFLKTEKLNEQPYIISRIRKEDSDVYGNGYSMECFPLLVQLQQIQRSITIGAQKNVEPPLNVPTQRLLKPYSTNPNAMNPMDILNGNLAQVTPTIGNLDLIGPATIKQQITADIDRTYMIDKIQLESVGFNRTAQEVAKRSGEEVKILSPFLGSLESEFLKPLIVITLDHLSKFSGPRTKEAIGALKKTAYNVRYVSDIARAQMKKSVNTLYENYQILANMAQQAPVAMQEFDWSIYIRRMIFLFNGPFEALKKPKAKAEENKQQEGENKLEADSKNLAVAGQAGKIFKDVNEGRKIGAELDGL